MAKLKNIVKQLSEKDFKELYDSLLDGRSQKSAYLLQALRERQLSESKIMVDLKVNPNAYYTMRSRLNQRIEEHLMFQMETPRTDILKKVANINETMFTKKKTISVATLRKLERELIDYDLANELTIIYKSLKKLHINSPEHFQLSQLYNRHVAYMLAVDKAEDLLADYFKKYGSYLLTGQESDKLSLTLMLKEMQNVSNLYESHRLYIFYSCISIFHRLFVEPEDNMEQEGESIEDTFRHVQKVFDTYNLDPLYYHLNLVFEFLKLEYYTHYKVFRQAERFFEEVNDAASNLIVNYPYFTFSARFLLTKFERAFRQGKENELFGEFESVFTDYEPDPNDVPRHLVITVYQVLAYYYVGKYDEACKMLNSLLTDVTLKRYPAAQIEVKALLALMYCLTKNYELLHQLIGSVKRGIRTLGKNACENVMLFVRILSIAASETKKYKMKKITALVPKFYNVKLNYFAPTQFIKIDPAFIKKLIVLEEA